MRSLVGSPCKITYDTVVDHDVEVGDFLVTPAGSKYRVERVRVVNRRQPVTGHLRYVLACMRVAETPPDAVRHPLHWNRRDREW